jgi:hypothetical protein
MRLSALLVIVLPVPALADDCADRLSRLLATDLTAAGPYVAMNVNTMAGMTQRYRHSFVSDRHYLVETLEPPGQPAMLHHEGAAWAADGNGGWTLAWAMDPDEAAAGIAAQRQALAGAVVSADCTSEAAGTETLTGRIGPTDTFGPEATVAYVVSAGTGDVRELRYAYRMNGMDITARYEIGREPGLALPVPPAR